MVVGFVGCDPLVDFLVGVTVDDLPLVFLDEFGGIDFYEMIERDLCPFADLPDSVVEDSVEVLPGVLDLGGHVMYLHGSHPLSFP